MSEVTSEEAKVNWIQRPKKLVLDSRSLPGQDRTGQGAQQVHISQHYIYISLYLAAFISLAYYF